MSVKNKAKDRDVNGRIRRKYTGPGSGYWLRQTPKWWRKLYMTKPKRRMNSKAVSSIRRGDDPDDMAYPLGNRKPHEYYW